MQKILKTTVKDNDNIFLKTLIIIFLLFICLYFYKLGGYGLFDVDEPRYPEVAREILESGNWIVPYFNYEVRYDKPILFYWLEAISLKYLDVNEFACRLPSVLSGLFCLFFLFYLVKTFYGVTVSLISVLILMSSLEYVALSRLSITDMTLNAFITSSIISFFLGYNHLLSSHRFFKFQTTKFSLWYIFAFVFLALATLTKGPVALVLVILVLLPFFWWIGSLGYFFKNTSFWFGLFLYFVIVLHWFLSVHFATSGEFTKIFFGLHNFSRFTTVVSGHKGSFFYYFLVLAIGILPWVFFLPQSIFYVFKKGLRSLLINPKEQLPWFCFWWFIVIFLFFSISQTKLSTYILPVFAPLSIILGLWFNSILQRETGNKGLVIGLGLFFFLCLGSLFIFLSNFPLALLKDIKPLNLDLFFISISFLMLVGIGMAWSSSIRNIPLTISLILLTIFLVYFSLITVLLPKVDRDSQYLLRSFAKSLPKEVEVATYLIVKPSLTFYGKKQIHKIDSLDLLQEKLNQKSKFAFVTKKRYLSGIMLHNAYLWRQDRRYLILTNYPTK